jgi:hypothetical protein
MRAFPFWSQLLVLFSVFLFELLNPSFSVKQFLFAGEKRMTLRTVINVYDVLRGPCCKRLTASAYCLYFFYLWMNFLFHDDLRV